MTKEMDPCLMFALEQIWHHINWASVELDGILGP